VRQDDGGCRDRYHTHITRGKKALQEKIGDVLNGMTQERGLRENIFGGFPLCHEAVGGGKETKKTFKKLSKHPRRLHGGIVKLFKSDSEEY